MSSPLMFSLDATSWREVFCSSGMQRLLTGELGACSIFICQKNTLTKLHTHLQE